MTATRTVTVEERAFEAMVSREVMLITGAGNSEGLHSHTIIEGITRFHKHDDFYIACKLLDSNAFVKGKLKVVNQPAMVVRSEPGVMIRGTGRTF